MKPTVTILGSIVAAMALTQGVRADHETTDSARSPATSRSHFKSNLEGKIMSLREYLGATASWGGGASSRETGRIDASGPVSPTLRDPQTVQDRAGQPDKPVQNDRNPAGLSSSTPTSTWTDSSPTRDEPLVFVVKSELSASSTKNPNNRLASSPPSVSPSNPLSTSQPAVNPTNPLPGAAAYGGEAYVLVFNPGDPDSRSAFAKAQSYRHSTTGVVTPDSDRLQVKGAYDSTTTTRQKQSDPDRTANDGSSRSGTRARGDAAPSTYTHAVVEGNLVRISGKILARGGIQAIEIASVQDAGIATAAGSVPTDK